MPWQERLKTLAQNAGAVFTRRSLSEVTAKEGHANFVTNIDLEVQSYLKDELSKLIPDSHFIGEESVSEALTDAPTWIVDPVDGTTNLIHDCRWSCVSIALCEGGAPTAGLIWQPYTGEMFFAEKGKGATLNAKSIRVSGNDLPNALVSFGTAPYNAELSEKGMKTALAFLRSCADIRRGGSAALDLASLACGRVDIFFELYLKPWDFAAGGLIVTEAGGSFRMPLSADGLKWDKPAAILASNPACKAQALSLFLQSVKTA